MDCMNFRNKFNVAVLVRSLYFLKILLNGLTVKTKISFHFLCYFVLSTNIGNTVACLAGLRAVMNPYRRVSEVGVIIASGSEGSGTRVLSLTS